LASLQRSRAAATASGILAVEDQHDALVLGGVLRHRRTGGRET
jgi:hypothetical protein